MKLHTEIMAQMCELAYISYQPILSAVLFATSALAAAPDDNCSKFTVEKCDTYLW